MAYKNKGAFYVCMNQEDSSSPEHLKNKSLYINGDLSKTLRDLKQIMKFPASWKQFRRYPHSQHIFTHLPDDVLIRINPVMAGLAALKIAHIPLIEGRDWKDGVIRYESFLKQCLTKENAKSKSCKVFDKSPSIYRLLFFKCSGEEESS